MIRGQVRSVSQICGFCEGNQHEIIVLSEGLCILIQMYREIVHISIAYIRIELSWKTRARDNSNWMECFMMWSGKMIDVEQASNCTALGRNGVFLKIWEGIHFSSKELGYYGNSLLPNLHLEFEIVRHGFEQNRHMKFVKMKLLNIPADEMRYVLSWSIE